MNQVWAMVGQQYLAELVLPGSTSYIKWWLHDQTIQELPKPENIFIFENILHNPTKEIILRKTTLSCYWNFLIFFKVFISS